MVSACPRIKCMQVIGQDARIKQGLAQLFKHRRSIIYTPEDHALVQERCACGPEVSERTASGAVDLCRVVDVQDNHYLERSRRQPLQ